MLFVCWSNVITSGDVNLNSKRVNSVHKKLIIVPKNKAFKNKLALFSVISKFNYPNMKCFGRIMKYALNLPNKVNYIPSYSSIPVLDGQKMQRRHFLPQNSEDAEIKPEQFLSSLDARDEICFPSTYSTLKLVVLSYNCNYSWNSLSMHTSLFK